MLDKFGNYRKSLVTTLVIAVGIMFCAWLAVSLLVSFVGVPIVYSIGFALLTLFGSSPTQSMFEECMGMFTWCIKTVFSIKGLLFASLVLLVVAIVWFLVFRPRNVSDADDDLRDEYDFSDSDKNPHL